MTADLADACARAEGLASVLARAALGDSLFDLGDEALALALARAADRLAVDLARHVEPAASP
ncbi:MAG: hypothetical protein IPM45_15640 [Acidimicrobiales bacterium]|nr:hypothetical protein [Acidimicrobiales bacterium]